MTLSKNIDRTRKVEVYKPEPMQLKFHQLKKLKSGAWITDWWNVTRNRLLVGGKGSGKTWAVIAEVVSYCLPAFFK